MSLKTCICKVQRHTTLLYFTFSGSLHWVINHNSSQQSQLPLGFAPGIFVKTCIADRKNEIYRKKCYLNHGESKAVFGNNDTPIGRNDSTCRNVFSLCLNDSRHAALPIGFTRVHGQPACMCVHEHTPSTLHPCIRLVLRIF